MVREKREKEKLRMREREKLGEGKEEEMVEKSDRASIDHFVVKEKSFLSLLFCFPISSQSTFFAAIPAPSVTCCTSSDNSDSLLASTKISSE